MPFTTACDFYWEDVGQHSRTAATMDRQLARLVEHFGAETAIGAVDDEAVAGYVRVARARPDERYRRPRPGDDRLPLVSAATVNRELELLRRVLRHAAKVHKAQAAPIDWTRHILAEPAGRVRALTAAEQARILEAAAPHLRPAIRFALLTGVRLAGVIGLDWRQVDLQARAVTFRIKTPRRQQSMSRTLELPITDAIFALLLELEPKAAGPVFTYRPRVRKGRPPKPARPIKSWRKAWAGALRRAGVDDLRWHDLRHTFATRLRRAGVDLRLLQDLLAHDDIASTARYTHVAGDDRRQALALLDDAAPMPAGEQSKKEAAR